MQNLRKQWPKFTRNFLISSHGSCRANVAQRGQKGLGLGNNRKEPRQNINMCLDNRLGTSSDPKGGEACRNVIHTSAQLPRLCYSMRETAQILGISYISCWTFCQRALLKRST